MAQDQPHWWQKNRRRVITIGIIGGCLCAIILIILVWLVYGTGFGESIIKTVSKATKGTEPTTITTIELHQPGKTLWDWMQLLIIPVVLALAALLFNLATTRTEQNITAQRYKNDQEIAADKQREDLLQTYLDRMSELLLNNHLRTSDPKDEVRYIARSRTLTVLSRLDAKRKKSLLQFLHESDLINATTDNIVHLDGADLINADLIDANLSGADLNGSNLSGADLSRAYLSNAHLTHADLSNASLYGAIMAGANLAGANLEFALNITLEQLEKAKSLKGATMRDGSIHP